MTSDSASTSVSSRRLFERLLPWFVLVIYWILLFISTHIRKVPPIQVYGRDRTLHFCAYFMLAIFFWLARHGTGRPRWVDIRSRITVLILVCYGALDEITQEVVGRQGDIYDWFFDVGGIFTAIVLLFVLRRSVYWLMFYFSVLFLITHWPGRGSAFMRLPLSWRQYQTAYMMAGYCGLALLWWRGVCGGGCFRFSRKVLILSLIVLPCYAFADEMINVWIGRGFDMRDFLSGLGGIALGIVSSILLSKHAASCEYCQVHGVRDPEGGP